MLMASGSAPGLRRLPTGLAVNAYNVKSKEHSDCVLRSSNNVLKGPLVDGRRHSHWIERDTDGSAAECPYVNDEKHGQWVERSANGTVKNRTYRNGEEVPVGRPLR